MTPRKSYKPRMVYVSDDQYAAALDDAARRDIRSFSEYVRRALEVMLAKGSRYTKQTGNVGNYPSGWPKDVVCNVCGQCHDPGDGSHLEPVDASDQTVQYARERQGRKSCGK